MALLYFTVPTEKDVGYKIGSLPVVGLHSFSVPDGGVPFNVDSTGCLYINDSGYEASIYPLSWVITVYPLGGGTAIDTHTVTFTSAAIPATSMSTVYVDPVHGINTGSGRQDSPLASLSLAMEKVLSNGLILLYNGGYGSLNLDGKPVTIKALKGFSPNFLEITSTVQGSYTLDRLTFLGQGISLESGYAPMGGSATVRKCSFLNSSGYTGILCNGYYLVSIMQNYLRSPIDTRAIFHNTGEISFTSNVISGNGTGQVRIETVDRITFLHNTIDGIAQVFIDDSKASFGVNGVAFVTITPELVASKTLVFPADFIYSITGVPSVMINIVEGSTQSYGTDWTASGGVVSWSGLGGEATFLVGATLRIVYQLDSPPSTGIGVFLIDSNNITYVPSIFFTVGVYSLFNHNNLFNSVANIPVMPTNIHMDPLYVDKASGNFSLQDASPSRHGGNPLLGYDPAEINGKLLYQQLQDINYVNREHKGELPDMGALENLSSVLHRTSPFMAMSQEGYDFVKDGELTSPVRRLSYAFEMASSDPIEIVMGEETSGVSSRKGFFDESTIALQGSTVNVQDPRTQPSPVVRSDFSSISPYDPSFSSLSKVYVSQEGDDTTGLGTLSKPFKTLDRALHESAPVICVIAGTYPMFTGVAGKSIVMLPRVNEILKGLFRDGSLSGSSWTVTEASETTYSLTTSKATISHP